jgi:CheY-like chemotaxis protein
VWGTFADASQLESAIVNLCVNSRDAMPEGGDLALETCNARLDEAQAHALDVRSGEYVCIAVTDSGSGMPPEVLARAFDPFFTTKSPGKGTGLGLSLIFGFVKQSDGHVKIDSQVGRGTTVSIYLPRYSGASHPVTAAPYEAPTADSKRETVLVVEDEDQVRGMTVEALRNLGYSVVAAAGPEEALDLIGAGTAPHLLFTDVVMPGMSGRTLAEHIKAQQPSIKVVFTTGYTPAELIDEALDCGAAWLPKPFTLDQLAAKVRAVLDGSA